MTTTLFRYRRVALTAFAAVVVTAANGAAAGVRQLPALTVTTLEGAAVAPGAIARPGQWLLVYLLPQSAACRSLVSQLDPLATSSGPNLVVIAGSDATAAKALVEAHPALAKATVLLDPTHGSFKALALSGVPVVFGMRDAAIAWTLGGTLGDPRELESILRTWLR